MTHFNDRCHVSGGKCRTPSACDARGCVLAGRDAQPDMYEILAAAANAAGTKPTTPQESCSFPYCRDGLTLSEYPCKGACGGVVDAPGTKPTNPKDIIGSSKLPLHLWPETATAMGCVALAEGMLKYGRANWRSAGVRASIYVDACHRHLAAWFEGEDTAPDSGVPHLANALACLAILVDAQAAGKLVDDRQVPGGYRALVENLTPHIERLKALHADKNPRHYTIADGEQP